MTKEEREQIINYRAFVDGFHYKENPVSVLEFISNPKYLGQSTNLGRSIYPIWKDKLSELFLHDEKFLVVLTGSIGTGKTTTSYLGAAYVMYRIMCLKDPWRFFNLADSGKMNITFFNLTKTLSDSRGFQTLQNLLMRSPWFLERGGLVRGSVDKYLDLPLFSYSLASPYAKGFGNVGEHVVVAVMDEVDSPTESEKQKIRILKAYEATVRRFESRFVIKGTTLARFFLVASKQDEMSFIETFIEQMKDSGKTYVADVPLYEAKPTRYYSGEKFSVKVGDTYTTPCFLNTPEEVKKAEKDGYRVVHIPVEYKEYFERDIVGALRDIAGQSVRGIRRSKLFPSERFINECYDPTKVDPISVQTIEMGLNDDDVNLINYLDFTRLRKHKSEPRFIHGDIGITGDAFGLGCSFVSGWTVGTVEKGDGTMVTQKVPIIETEWVMRLKAKHEDSIPIYKVRKFVMDLVSLGFNIAKFTIDLKLASEDTIQLLRKAGVNADYLSVDKDIKAYMNFRNLVFEKRWVMHRHSYLHFELKHLEYDRNLQKVDHPETVKDVEFLEDGDLKDVVMKGSKDLADAVAGSVMSCLLHGTSGVDLQDAVELMKMISSSPGKEKDPYWFANVGKNKDQKVIGSGQVDTQKQIDLMKKFM